MATLVIGCKQSNPEENPAASATNSLSQNAKEMATNAWQKTKDVTTNAWVDLKDTMQPVADYTYDKKDEFVAAASADLAALDQRIKELSDKAASASDSVKNEAQTKLQNLREKRAEAGKKLDEVKNAGQADWNELKTGFQTSYDDVKNSLKQTWQWLTDKMNS